MAPIGHPTDVDVAHRAEAYLVSRPWCDAVKRENDQIASRQWQYRVDEIVTSDSGQTKDRQAKEGQTENRIGTEWDKEKEKEERRIVNQHSHTAISISWLCTIKQ